ncbi:unnamed protein product [Lepidochelys kempii]
MLRAGVGERGGLCPPEGALSPLPPQGVSAFPPIGPQPAPRRHELRDGLLQPAPARAGGQAHAVYLPPAPEVPRAVRTRCAAPTEQRRRQRHRHRRPQSRDWRPREQRLKGRASRCQRVTLWPRRRNGGGCAVSFSCFRLASESPVLAASGRGAAVAPPGGDSPNWMLEKMFDIKAWAEYIVEWAAKDPYGFLTTVILALTPLFLASAVLSWKLAKMIEAREREQKKKQKRQENIAKAKRTKRD